MRLGIDLLAIDELDRLLQRPWFCCFVFAESELTHAAALETTRRREFLAGRFAAKEAILKVLGRGLFQGVHPSHVEVVRGVSGEPEVRLHGPAHAAAIAAGIGGVAISLTHKQDQVVAVALGYPSAFNTGGAA
jgi:holo-[acyl-carrier protein] synthase